MALTPHSKLFGHVSRAEQVEPSQTMNYRTKCIQVRVMSLPVLAFTTTKPSVDHLRV